MSRLREANVIELTRTNDLVFLGFLEALLRDGGLNPIVLDAHVSAVEGSIGAIPRRLMIARDEENAARRILREAKVTLQPGP